MINSRNESYLCNAVCIAVIVCCVILGLIGLVLPIIPGLLFLFFAAILLARISSRFESLLYRHPVTAGWLNRWNSAKNLSFPQQLKLSFWITVKTLISSVESGVKLFKNYRRKH